MKWKTLTISVLLLTTLTGCSVFGIPRVNEKGEVPLDLQHCFDEVVPRPTEAPLTSGQVFDLIVKLKESELEKTLCGRRLLAWIETTQG